MQRKIIKQGADSYTVTLPRAWVKESGLTGGDLLTLSELDGTLVLSPEKAAPKPRMITVDLKTRSHRDILNTLNQSYRKGFDKITLHYSKQTDLAEINRIVKNTMLGFEVTIEEKGTCTIENIAEPSPDKFETIFKKLSYLFKTEAREIISDIKTNNFQTLLREQQKNQIHLYTNYLRRTLICSRAETKANSHLLYYIISQLSLAQHSYYYLHERTSKQKKQLSKKVIDQLEMTLELSSLLFDALFKKDMAFSFRIQELKKNYYEKFFTTTATQCVGTDVIGISHTSEIVLLLHMAGTAALGYLFTPQE